MCKINHFQIFLLIAIEMVVLSVFSHKESLGPLGAKLSGLPILNFKLIVFERQEWSSMCREKNSKYTNLDSIYF